MTDYKIKTLEDVKINVKIKIAALWATIMLLFAYVDIFSYFRPGLIEGIIAGQVSGMEIDQLFLTWTTAYVTVPSLMVFASLVLTPRISRPLNIVLGILYAASILVFCIGESWAYYIIVSVIESILLMAVVWYAWKWPRQDVVERRVNEKAVVTV